MLNFGQDFEAKVWSIFSILNGFWHKFNNSALFVNCNNYPTCSISDVQTWNKYITTNRISIYTFIKLHTINLIQQISETWAPSMGTLLKCNINIETERQKDNKTKDDE